MEFPRSHLFRAAGACCVFLVALSGCKAKSGGNAGPRAASNPAIPAVANATAPPQVSDDAPPPGQTGGFDGKRAFAHVAKQVEIGPRAAGSQAILRAQDYILAQLSSYGCTVETDGFSSDTPAGRLPMKNILVKIPGERSGILLLATHYDTKKLDNFVGADDGGSSTAVMLELARLLCAQRGRYQVWIAFFDAEEAVNFDWKDPDNRYGSRQMAARLATSGQLKDIKAFLLADIVGSRNLRIKRDASSSKALTELVWSTAARLGYGSVFVNDLTSIEDDHESFAKRGVPVVDVIDLEIPYWHTTQDTLDKVSAKSLAIVGHVFLESVKQIQSK